MLNLDLKKITKKVREINKIDNILNENSNSKETS